MNANVRYHGKQLGLFLTMLGAVFLAIFQAVSGISEMALWPYMPAFFAAMFIFMLAAYLALNTEKE